MEIDYFKLIRESLKFTWKYKILWVFGFILALFSGGGGSGGGGSSSSSESESASSGTTNDAFDQIGKTMDKFLHSPYFWIMIIAIILIGLLILVVTWYCTRISKAALINAVRFDSIDRSEDIKLKKLWKSSSQFIKKFLIFDSLWFLINIPVILIFSIPILLGIIVSPVFFFILCIIVPVFIVFIILSSAMKTIGERLLVLEGDSPLDCIKRSWKILRSNLGKYILAWLVFLLPGCAFGLINLFLSFVALVPLILAVLPFFLSESTYIIGIGVGICGLCFYGIILSLIRAPFIVFENTYWTKFLMILFEDKQIIKEAEVVQK